MPRFASWLGLSGLIIVLDQLTKFWVVSALSLGQSIELTGFLNLVFVYNPGAAFSFLSDAGGWQRWFFVALALAVSAWLTFLIRQHAAERLLPLAATLILGGALGNVIDRIRFGAVVDFVDVHAAGWHWPAFNVADSAISVGVALLLWQQLFLAPKETR
ncbi:MAG: lipoprotein signal peptidase [Rhodocyclaceae bacterium]|jgi:signal peptidase II|uniref:Lipoprotein signal peptidase n=1 Tax=Candidatus Desulfobacillus denitrificans TaxID=2608985 RepID=A0A809SBG6_9PROT|nr:lipoprotein signal peptidase [Rhodocyclaceae bacterium]OQY70494.1 MAG: signal peptidase II [Rhodocyclaceae bacterium UTPRO2]BBO21564.1 signal peptidase II [Candidatus Desulfobacillus denitrificans]GIK46399.1 MAG: lipoprotein signal peptidase [Betaproteobacteria bacterium]GJQ55934.1 MAG: lipoprotein signal peptidase [Rhodocyclaceae bacterium]